MLKRIIAALAIFLFSLIAPKSGAVRAGDASGLVPCAECGAMIARAADVCPKCGAPRTKGKWKTSDKISAVTFGLGLLGLAFGIWQYNSSENWKRREFVAAQIKEFYADGINRAVLLMMDYSPARVELYPEANDVDKRYVDVEFDTLVNAIRKEQNFEGDEFRVRIYFEHFLNALSRLNYYIEYNAISPAELCSDFAYPVALMIAEKPTREKKQEFSKIDIRRLARAVDMYLKRWENIYVQNFMQSISRACQ